MKEKVAAYGTFSGVPSPGKYEEGAVSKEARGAVKEHGRERDVVAGGGVKHRGDGVTTCGGEKTGWWKTSSLLVAVAVLGFAACGVAFVARGVGVGSLSAMSDAAGGGENFRAFLCYFTPEMDSRHLFNPGDFEYVKMAVASAQKNFQAKAAIDLVTTGNDADIRTAFENQITLGQVNIVNIPLCGPDDALPDFACPGSFVDVVDQLKAAYVAQHPGENVAYFEADMVIQPGGGDAVRNALAYNDFDVGYTYQPDYMTRFYDGHCGANCGSLNSGFILWKNAGKVTDAWNHAVLTALYSLGGSFTGGENQAATDMIVGQRQVPQWSVVEGWGGTKVLSLPFQQYNFVFGSPEMMDAGDTEQMIADKMKDPNTACCAQKDNPILHFYGGFKPGMLSKCCKDLIYAL